MRQRLKMCGVLVDAQKPYRKELLEAGRALAGALLLSNASGCYWQQDVAVPKCGIAARRPRRPSSLTWPVAAGTKPTSLRATVQTDAPLHTGVKTNGRLHLTHSRATVASDQLREVHTKRIDLLLVDG